jgi:hypothetical protein
MQNSSTFGALQNVLTRQDKFWIFLVDICTSCAGLLKNAKLLGVLNKTIYSIIIIKVATTCSGKHLIGEIQIKIQKA